MLGAGDLRESLAVMSKLLSWAGSGAAGSFPCCLQEMALEGSVLVGGAQCFLSTPFHRGTQAWQVSGTLGMGLQIPGSSIPVCGDTDRLSWHLPASRGSGSSWV